MKRFAIPAILALALGLSACTGSSSTEADGPVPGEDNCTAVVVGTSSEKVNLMEDLGKKFKASSAAKGLGKCATVYPINVPSGKGSEILSKAPEKWPLQERAYWPTVWSPASTVWTDRVAATGSSALGSEAKSFAKTPVAFGVPASMAKALDYPNKPISIKQIEKLIANPEGWGSVGKPIWGKFKIAKTNPNTSTTGLSTILMQSYANSGKAKDLTAADIAASADFNRTFESGAIHYGDTTGKVLKTLADKTKKGSGSGYVSAIALEETSIFNYNLGNPDSHTVQPGEKLVPPKEKLVAVYPAEGSVWSDNPATVLASPWVTAEQAKASEAFVKFLQTKEAQETLPKYGFRPVDAAVDGSDFLNAKVGIDLAQPKVTLPKPAADVVSAAIDQWATVRKPSAVLELIDISGSMDENAGNGKTKLEGAIESARGTLGNFRRTDKIGIWAFTTRIESKLGKNLVPVREFGPLADDKENLRESISDLANSQRSGTPLYDAVSKGYDYMLKQAEEGRINAIVVLSDGEDTDSQTSIDSLLTKINSSAKEGTTDAPVRIFAIGYGAGADLDTLDRIARASGGQSFDATDPERINEVFAQVINNF